MRFLPAFFLLAIAPMMLAQTPESPAAQPVYGKAIATEINPGQMVTYRSSNQDISAYLVTPKVAGKTPAVIWVHDIFGMTDFARAQADLLARQGYTVLVPNLYSRLPNPDHALDAQGAWLAYDKIPDDQVVKDLLAGIDYLEEEGKPTTGQPLAVVGHDMGGIYAMMLGGADLRVSAAVNYYGRILYAITTPNRPRSPVEDLMNLHAPLLSFYGDIDPQVPPDHIQAMERRLQANPNKAFYQIVQIPNVGHSFLVPTRPGYNEKAATDAQAKTRDFLAQYLRAAPKTAEE